MQIQYSHHLGSMVAIVHCPNICGKRLVHLSKKGKQSWVIRDYIGARQLRRSPPPNASFSTVDLKQIEDEVAWFEEPPRHARTELGDWEAYLRLRSMVILKGEDGLPKGVFGTWRPLK